MAAAVIRALVTDTLAKASPTKIIAGNPNRDQGLQVWDLVMRSNMSNEKDMELHFQVQAYVRFHVEVQAQVSGGPG